MKNASIIFSIFLTFFIYGNDGGTNNKEPKIHEVSPGFFLSEAELLDLVINGQTVPGTEFPRRRDPKNTTPEVVGNTLSPTARIIVNGVRTILIQPWILLP